MRVGVRSVHASGKICMTLLLGVVTVAMVIPDGDVAFSQGVAEAVVQAPLFTALDLNPPGFTSSEALGISGGKQVGVGSGPATGGNGHALLWRGSADSVVDLHPSGYASSEALGISGGQQVGVGSGPATGGLAHALMWTGSASSVADLHPKGFTQSYALGTSGGQQVGYGSLGNPGNEPGNIHHALLWRGSAASVVDLHPSGYTSSSEAHGISGDQQVGWGRIAVPRGRDHALMWRSSAVSAVDLHPSGFVWSKADGTSGRQQVGYGQQDGGCIGPPGTYALMWRGSATSVVDLTSRGFYLTRSVATSGGEQVGDDGGYPHAHAVLWSGSATSVVNLHAFLPQGFDSSSATGIDSNGDIVGYAGSGDSTHAFLWKRNVNVKPVLPVDKGTASRGLIALKPLMIASDDAVAYILTDPEGRRTGYDPVHNMSYHDIPGSVYRIETCENHQQTTVLEMADRMDGRYTLDVYGDGEFKVYVSAWGVSGHWLTHSFEGKAEPGASSRFTFQGEVNIFTAFGATLKIYSASQAFALNGTFTLGPGGTIAPTAQFVTIQIDNSLWAVPVGSFRQTGPGAFVFKGVINGDAIDATLTPTGANGYAFKIEGANAAKIEGAKAAQMSGIGLAEATNRDYPIRIGLAIGNNGGSISVTAEVGR